MTERFGINYRTLGPLPIVLGLVLVAVVVLVTTRRDARSTPSSAPTVADLKPVHAGVRAGGLDVRGLRRLSAGDRVETDAEGRARLRLDDGTTCILDRSTRIRVAERGLRLESGRIFVEMPEDAKGEIGVGALEVAMSGARAGFERRGERARVYAADGELSARHGGVEKKIATGESATLDGSALSVVPERAFDDWTRGLAAPWAARGTPRRAIGELWASSDEKLEPLSIRAHAVFADVGRDSARTRTETTFFNGGSQTISGDFRMPIPEDAIVARFALERGGVVQEASIALAAREGTSDRPDAPVLEWAGEGWLRAAIPSLNSGETLKVVVEYVEWPASEERGQKDVLQYRYPLAGDGAPPLIGEFSLRVQATSARAESLRASHGAVVSGRAVELRRSDFRPTADFVLEIEQARAQASARLYQAPASDPSDEAGATWMLRTELPRAEAPDGVTLAILVDASGSVDAPMLDAERALVEAVLEGLGKNDRALVLAADQDVRPLGPATLGAVDAARRASIGAALRALVPGGATHLGAALSRAAGALPEDEPSALLLYVGDGRPTLGDGTLEALRARLERRKGGAPRFGAVAVGPLANRGLLAALARGSGPLFEIDDSADAARIAVDLLSEALRPALAAVEVDLGPLVDRVFPRSPRTVPAGEGFFAVGRARGKLPRDFVLRWRDRKGLHEERRPLELAPIAEPGDVRRRWARERVEEIVLDGRGREAATDVALRAGLLTPWTAWRVGGSGEQGYAATPFGTRFLDLAPSGKSALAAVLATPSAEFGALTAGSLEPEGAPADAPKALEAAIALAAERVITEAGAAVRACRESRTALRPELDGALRARVEIDDQGRAAAVRVRGESPVSDDPALNRCVEVVLRGLRYPGAGLGVRVVVERTIPLPPVTATLGARRCSATSRLPTAQRRGVWRERITRGQTIDVYLEAKQACELPTWNDRRAFLELALLTLTEAQQRLEIARGFQERGELDAATFFRREAVRRVRSPEELVELQQELLATERYPRREFERRYLAAGDDRRRLEVVRRFLELAPHDSFLRRRLVALVEALGERQALLAEIREIRRDPFADAELLADAASALRRAGEAEEARRTFGEIAERAPRDPWVRGFLGDRLRREGLFDDATAAYEVLSALMPDDAAVLVRLALAHASAGRVDLAGRLLTRLAETGGRSGNAGLGALAGHLGSVTLADALAAPARSAAERERLSRLTLEIPRSDRDTVILVRAEPAARPLDVSLALGATREARTPELSSADLGIYVLRVGPIADAGVRLSLARPKELPPARALRVRLDAIVPGGAGVAPRVVTREIELAPDGERRELVFSAAEWRAG